MILFSNRNNWAFREKLLMKVLQVSNFLIPLHLRFTPRNICFAKLVFFVVEAL